MAVLSLAACGSTDGAGSVRDLPAEWAVLVAASSLESYQTPSIAVDSELGVHIAFYQGAPYPDLMYAFKSHEGPFSIVKVDSIQAGTVPYPDCMIAVGGSGDAHIVYSEYGYARYASNADGTWLSSNLTSIVGMRGAGDVAVDDLGAIHILATNVSGNITCFTYSDDAWTSDPIAGYWPEHSSAYAIALDGEGKVHACFYGYNETGHYALWYAKEGDGSWLVRMLSSVWDDSEFWGRPSIALSHSGEVYVVVSADYLSTAFVPGSNVIMYHLTDTSHYSTAVSASAYLPARAAWVDAQGNLHVLVNSYWSGTSFYPVYFPDGDYPWGAKTPPPVRPACAALDTSDDMHTVSLDDGFLKYLSNSYDVPASPMYVSASVTGTSIVLSWSPPESDGGLALEGYRIYMGNYEDPLVNYNSVVSVEPGLDNYTFTGLEPNTGYYFAMTACNQLGEGYLFETAYAMTGLNEPSSLGDDGDLLWPLALVAAGVVACVVAIWLWTRARTWP